MFNAAKSLLFSTNPYPSPVFDVLYPPTGKGGKENVDFKNVWSTIPPRPQNIDMQIEPPSLISRTASAAAAIPGTIAVSAIKSALQLSMQASMKAVAPLARLAWSYVTPQNALAGIGLGAIYNWIKPSSRKKDEESTVQTTNNNNPTIHLHVTIQNGNEQKPAQITTNTTEKPTTELTSSEIATTLTIQQNNPEAASTV